MAIGCAAVNCGTIVKTIKLSLIWQGLRLSPFETCFHECFHVGPSLYTGVVVFYSYPFPIQENGGWHSVDSSSSGLDPYQHDMYFRCLSLTFLLDFTFSKQTKENLVNLSIKFSIHSLSPLATVPQAARRGLSRQCTGNHASDTYQFWNHLAPQFPQHSLVGYRIHRKR